MLSPAEALDPDPDPGQTKLVLTPSAKLVTNERNASSPELAAEVGDGTVVGQLIADT